MDSNISYEQSIDFDSFCSVLETLKIEDEIQLNSIPIDERVNFLLKVLSSDKSYELKRKAILILESLFSDKDDEKRLTLKMASESNIFITRLIITEENELHQQQLVALCFTIMKWFNKDKKNKWENVMSMLIRCVTSYNSNLTKMIYDALTNEETLFGEETEEKLIQFNHFLISSLKGFNERPQVTLFAMGMLRFLLLNHEVESIPDSSLLVTILMDAMEALVLTDNGIYFMQNIQRLLLSDHNIFERNIKVVMEKMVLMLSDNRIKKSVKIHIFGWLTLLFTKFPEEIEENFYESITIIFEKMLNFQIESYPDYPIEWFTNFQKSKEVCLCHDVVAIYSNLTFTADSLKFETVNQILFEKATEMLKSSNWKIISTGIDALCIIVECSEGTMISDPFLIFNLVIPYFQHDNPKVICSAITVTEKLCLNFHKGKFSKLHTKAIPLIIDTAAFNDSLFVKAIALFALGSLSTYPEVIGRKDGSKNVFKLLEDLFNSIFNNCDPDLLDSVARSIYLNVDFIYCYMGYKYKAYIPGLAKKLIKTLDKVYSVFGFNYQTHKLIDCISNAESHSSFDESGKVVVDLIQGYIVVFKSNHNLPNDFPEIPPCFFPLFKNVAKCGADLLVKIQPKLAESLTKVLTENKKQLLSMDKSDLKNFEGIRLPYGCPECVSNKFDSGMGMVCGLFSTMVFHCSGDWSLYIEIFLQTLSDMLKITCFTPLYSNIAGYISDIMHSCFFSGEEEGARKVWESFLKSRILSILDECEDFDSFGLIFETFTDFITIEDFYDPLDSADINYLGIILNKTLVHLIRMNDSLPQVEAITKNQITHCIEVNLDTIQNCLARMISCLTDEIVNMLPTMFETILLQPKSCYFYSFINFSNSVIFDVLEDVSQSEIENSGLMLIFFKLTTDVLLECTDDDILESTVEVVRKLKAKFSEQYEKYHSCLSPKKSSVTEKLTSKNWRKSFVEQENQL